MATLAERLLGDPVEDVPRWWILLDQVDGAQPSQLTFLWAEEAVRRTRRPVDNPAQSDGSEG